MAKLRLMRSPAENDALALPVATRGRRASARRQARRRRCTGASTPRAAGTTRTSSRDAVRARRSRASSSSAETRGWIRPSTPPKTTSVGLKMLTSEATPMPSHSPTREMLAQAAGFPGHSCGDSSSTAARPPLGRRPAFTSMARSLISVSQAPERAAGAGRAARIHDHVADLTRVPVRTDKRPATDRDAPAHADLARHVDDIGGTDRRAASMLREPTEVGIVGDSHGRFGPERHRRADRPSGTSLQPRFGTIRTSPSLCRTVPATATPIPTRLPSRRAASSSGRASSRQVRDDLVDGDVGPGPIDSHEIDGRFRRARPAPRRASRR